MYEKSETRMEPDEDLLENGWPEMLVVKVGVGGC